jgi:hypothetical protein
MVLEACAFSVKESSPLQSPFQFADASGAWITNGTRDTVTGVCVPTNATCADPSTRANCCSTAPVIGDDYGGANFYPMIAFVIASAFYKRILQKPVVNWLRPRRADGRVDASFGSRGAVFKEMFKGRQPSFKYVIGFLMLTMCAAQIFEMTIMPPSVQATLSPQAAAAKTAMSSFLEPVKEVFAFLEDVMLVKVSYALAQGNLEELNQLLHASVLFGLTSGALSFLLMAAVAAGDGSAAALLNPAAAPNNALIASGCTLIPSTDELLSVARPFWLLSCATWMPTFATMGFTGFLAGAGRFEIVLLPVIIGLAVPISIWFGLKGSASGIEPLTVLGLAYGVGPWLNALLCLAVVACSPGLRARYGLRWLLAGAGRGQGVLRSFLKRIQSVGRDGLDLMVVDLAVQLSGTIATYVGASQGFEIPYQLAAAGAAYPLFGPAMLVPISFLLKLVGSKMVAGGQTRAFAAFSFRLIFLTCALGAGAIFTAFHKHRALSYTFGESACIYATEPACTPVYARIFLKAGSLLDVFEAFGPTVALNMLFYMARMMLSVCQDFTFMARAAAASFALVFIPAILVARYAYNTPLAYYVAMYVPHFVLIVIYGWRMWSHLMAFATDRPGPWTEHARAIEQAETAVSKLDPADVEAAQQGGDPGTAYVEMDEVER